MTLQQALADVLIAAKNSTEEQIYDTFRRLTWQDQEELKEILYKAGFLTSQELQQYDVLLILRKIAHHFALSEYLVELILKQNLNIDDMIGGK